MQGRGGEGRHVNPRAGAAYQPHLWTTTTIIAIPDLFISPNYLLALEICTACLHYIAMAQPFLSMEDQVWLGSVNFDKFILYTPNFSTLGEFLKLNFVNTES